MVTGKMDTYSTMVYQNYGEAPEFNSEFMANNSFFPFFAITKTKEDSFYKKNAIDIWDSNLFGGGMQNQVFDMDKLERYIELQITLRYKYTNGTDNRYSIPFRNCK